MRFQTRINLNGVTASGSVRTLFRQHKTNEIDFVYVQIDPRYIPALRSWNRDMTIHRVLNEIRTFMSAKENAKLSQPSEGSLYPFQ